eukprot:TRINITY_DN4787_c0_g1_i5.p1 TRINITY_DN4787_c0_g1~~TRINITY_DN4787_c0_g1_i5.p1  ORF type:complete len:343 (-),score=49.82 TRINITY_DN4787_c0_g1_i5:108-1136(-)
MEKANPKVPLLATPDKGLTLGRVDTGFIRTHQVINRPLSNQHVWFSDFEMRNPDVFIYYYSVSFVLIMGVHACLAKIARSVSPIEQLTLRSLFILIFLVIYRQRVDQNIQFNDKKFGKTLLGLSLLNVIVNYCYLSGIAKLSLTEGLSIMLIYPVLLPVVSKVMFGDDIQNYQLVCFVITCVGVVFIWRPPYIFGSEANQTADVSMGVLLCGLQAVVSAFTVMLKRNRAPSLQTTTIFSQGAIASVVISIPVNIFYGWEVPSLWSFVQILLMAAAFFTAHIINTRIITESSRQLYYVNVIRYAQLVVALAFDYYVLNDLPDHVSCLGILLLIVSGFYQSKNK